MDSHFLLQGIFPTQGPNPHLLHWQASSLLTARAAQSCPGPQGSFCPQTCSSLCLGEPFSLSKQPEGKHVDLQGSRKHWNQLMEPQPRAGRAPSQVRGQTGPPLSPASVPRAPSSHTIPLHRGKVCIFLTNHRKGRLLISSLME